MNQIMNLRAFAVARKYITYRYKRALVRKSNSTDQQILSLRESFLALNDIKEYYSKDGMHPNEAGYAIIRDDFTKYFSSCAR